MDERKDARGVLLTDGNERSALAVTRSLGQKGIDVFVGAETPVSLAGSSKYCTESFVYPSPWKSPDDYVSCILERARHYGAPVAFPMTDLAIELLGGQALSVPIPSLDRYHALSDKFGLMSLAQEEGIPIPQTYFVRDADISDVLPRISQWPVVVKPGRSLVKVKGRWKKTSVGYAHTPDELCKLYGEVEELQAPSLVQSRIVGQGEGVFGLFAHGHSCALFAHRRLREKPPSGGVSVLRESIELTEPMAGYALTIARLANWHGVIMVEFKVDHTMGTPFLMEVNGRFWGSLQLAIDSGVDFPWLLYQLATTGRVPETPPYQTGIKSRWWLGDLDHLLLRMKNSDRELSLPPGSPSKMQAVWTFLNIFDRRTKSEVMRLSDLHPGIYEVMKYFDCLRKGMTHSKVKVECRTTL